MPFDDEAAEPYGSRPPPHPDDRLWRHPSELGARQPPAPRPRWRGLHWGAVATLGTASVMLAGAAALVVGVRTPDVGTGLRQQASATPLVPETTATTSTMVTPTSRFLDDEQLRRIGIEVSDDQSGQGVAVAAVAPDSPAADSGLHADDVIVDVDGTPITDLTALAEALAALDAGDEVLVTVQPGTGPADESVTLEVTVGDLTGD